MIFKPLLIGLVLLLTGKASCQQLVMHTDWLGALTTNQVVLMSTLGQLESNLAVAGEKKKNTSGQLLLTALLLLQWQEKLRVVDQKILSGRQAAYIARISTAIIKLEAALISTARTDPFLLPLALQTQLEVAQRLTILLTKLHGLVFTGGDENLLDAADRLSVMHLITEELKIIRGICQQVLRRMELTTRFQNYQLSPLFPDKDKTIAHQILESL